MMPLIPSPNRDRLDVGFPDFIRSREAVQVALHKGAFTQDEFVVVCFHRHVPLIFEGIRLNCMNPKRFIPSIVSPWGGSGRRPFAEGLGRHGSEDETLPTKLETVEDKQGRGGFAR